MVGRINSSTDLILILVILSGAISLAQEYNHCPETPEISIAKYYPKVSFSVIRNDSNNAIIHYHEPVQMELLCRSRRPIYWDYGRDTELIQYRFIRPKRTAMDPFDNSTFCFELTLFLYRLEGATGNYTCKTVASEPVEQSSLYLYIQGFSQSPFIDAHTSEFPKIAEPRLRDNKWTLVPCKVQSPWIEATLLNGSSLTYGEFLPSHLTQWDPAQGFWLNIENIPTYEGVYTCIVDQDDFKGETSVYVRQREPNSPMPNITLGRRDSAIECSGPPKTDIRDFTYKWCNNPMECWNMESISPEHLLINGGFECTNSINRVCKRVTPPATTERLVSGVAQCVAGATEGSLSYSQTLYRFHTLSSGAISMLTNETLNKALFGKEPLFNASVVVIHLKPITSTKFYVGQQITLECEASPFMIAEGMEWTFTLRNGRKLGKNDVTFTESYSYDKARPGYAFTSTMSVKLWTTDLETVTCMGPLWSSFEWAMHSRNITVHDGTQPTFSNMISSSKRIQKTLYVGTKAEPIPCTAEGNPVPEITWTLKGAESLPPGVTSNVTKNEATSNGVVSKNTTSLERSTAYLSFATLAENLKGEYICTASNYAGSKSQSFHIDIATSSGFVAAIVSAIVAIIILMLIVGFMYHHLVLQKKIINQFLSEKELDEFFYGNPDLVKNKSFSPEYSQFLPYNKEYEIPPTNIQIDNEAVLGSGQYGIVYKGTLAVDSQEKPVAVKTVKPLADKEYVKALLSEIKIMMSIGNHSSIVNFIGALTPDIKEGKLLVVVEFCTNGSLEKYLRRYRDTFVDMIENDALAFYSTPVDNTDDELNSRDLVKWAYEIAAGMEYLSVKKVIHADLACRNILVTGDRTVKITDFGLSRQLYESSNYQKKTQAPLPWRWMAIESLKDMNFSVHSDVWSYGVTVWEIFSLGAVPYPGYNWDEVFLKKLESGLRMDKPEYANTAIYSTILRCMETTPEQRLGFPAAKNFFHKLLLGDRSHVDNYAQFVL